MELVIGKTLLYIMFLWLFFFFFFILRYAKSRLKNVRCLLQVFSSSLLIRINRVTKLGSYFLLYNPGLTSDVTKLGS